MFSSRAQVVHIPGNHNPSTRAPSGSTWTGLRPKRFIIWLGILAVALAVGKWSYDQLHPPPDIPLPKELDQLQPQLRAYLLQIAAGAQAAPRDPQSHATLGIAYAANQLWLEAKLCFENAARLSPNEPLPQLYLGVAAEELGDYPSALRIFHGLTERFPTFPQGFFRVGRLALQSGSLEEAESAFVRLVDLAPGEWRGHAGLGEIALRRGNLAVATGHLEKAVALDPNAGNAHSLLGLAYRGLGRTNEAEFEMARGVNSPNYPMPDPWGETAHQHMRLVQDQIEIANRLSLEDAPDRAVDLLATAITYSPTNLALLNALAISLSRANQPDHARIVLNQLFTLNQDYLPGIITASLVANHLGQTNETLAFARRAIHLAPESAHSHVALANALLSLEKDSEAAEALTNAMRYDPSNAELHLQIGDVLLLNLGRPDQALDHYQSACDLRPTLVSAQVRRARMQIEQGNVAEAKQALDIIEKLEPTHPALAVLRDQLQGLDSSGQGVQSPGNDQVPTDKSKP